MLSSLPFRIKTLRLRSHNELVAEVHVSSNAVALPMSLFCPNQNMSGSLGR